MADALTVAGKTATVVAGGVLTGAPPEFLVTAVLAGAAVSAYLQHGALFEPRPRWVARVLGHASVAALFGYTASTALVQALPGIVEQYNALRPLLALDQWIYGVTLSGTSHWSLPMLQRRAESLMAPKPAPVPAQAPAEAAGGKKAEGSVE
jgi:hypothetical protein